MGECEEALTRKPFKPIFSENNSDLFQFLKVSLVDRFKQKNCTESLLLRS